MSYFEDFQAALNRRDSPALLRLWEEYTSSDEVDGKDFQAILEVTGQSDLKDYIGRHIERSLPLWRKLKPDAISEDILRLIIDLETSGTNELRQLATEFLESKFKNTPYHQEKMRMVGLRSQTDEFKGCISHYLLVNHLKKGNFVFHKNGWGVGEVVDISMLREQASFEFDYAPGRKDLSFKVCFINLIPIPSDHFLARRFGNPDALEKLARENPTEVIQMLLRDLGPKTAGEIKDELCELVIPEADWNRWWQSTRAKLKKDTMIENPADLKSPFKLLSVEVSHEEKLYKALENKPDANTLIQMVFSFLRDFPETLKNAEFKQALKTKLSEMLSFSEITLAQELQIQFFLQDLNSEKESSKVKEIIKKAPSLKGLVMEIPIQGFKKRLLSEIQKDRPEWKEIFLDLLTDVQQNLLRDFILSELLGTDAETALKKRLEDLAANPKKHPEAVIWYFQKITALPSLPFGDAKDLSRFFEAMLILLSFLEQAPENRELLKKVQDIVAADRYAIVRQVMKGASEKEVQEFLLLVTKCHSLSDHDIKIFHSLAEVAHPNLAKKAKKQEAPKEEDEIVWTTNEGYAQLQKRIEQIGTVETVENAKEIEVARAHGDLRENAEFKAALEKRDRLQAELKFLSSQLNKCRILTAQDITTDKVSVGVTVECKAGDGEKVSYTLLGPWEANPDKNILSFQSKLARSMVGLKVGDSFDLQGKKLKITAIRSAL